MLILIYGFYFWILSIYFDRFLVKKNLSLIYKIITWSLFAFLQLFLLGRIDNALLLFCTNCLLTSLIGHILYQGSVRKIVFLSAIGCATGMLTEIFVAFALQLIGHSLESTVFVGLIASRLILLSMVHGISIYQRQRIHDAPSSLCWALLFCMTFFSIFIMHTIFYLNQNSNLPYGDILSFAAAVLLLIMNMSFYVFYNKLTDAANEQIENYMIYRQLKHYEELRINGKAQTEHFKREKHNLKNQLLAIHAYALHNQNEKIIQFVDELLSDPDFGLTPETICDNLLLNTLLSSKINIAKQNNIKYTWDISVPAQLPFDNIDLCILIGNAIDNAFEACSQDNMNSRHIHISIQYKSGNLLCCFKNTYSHELIPSQNFTFASTKPHASDHGYGLSSIRKVVNKYSGLLDIDTIENYFTLKTAIHTTS